MPVEFGVDSLPDALSAAGHRTDQPSLYAVEGLTEPQVRDLLHTLSGLGAPGSRLAVNFGLGAEAATSPNARAATHSPALVLKLSGEHINFRLHVDDATDFLTTTGWTTQQILTAAELTHHYLAATTLPVTGLKPTAFAVTTTTT